MLLDRRTFLLGGAVLGGALRAQTPATAPSYSHEYPDMLLAHLSGKLNTLCERWDRERDSIRSAEALAQRNRFVREKFVEMLRGYPEKNPLRAKITNARERDGYRIENVTFESRPNFLVTGNLYIPDSGSGPFPAVISPCGHYSLARMQPDYQFVYLNLVKAGFVVLAYDPIGQGERRYYWNPRTDGPDGSLDPVYEHSMPGQLLLLIGENLSAYRIWDGMRAIDYLLTRPEVDASRIGCAGHSGGGTLSLFISALDERVRCAVVNEGGTGHRWPIHIDRWEPVGPSDIEQNLFPSALYGIDQCDLHVAIAPRPLLALTEEYTPEFIRAAGHIRARYAQFGVPEKFATDEATDPHAYTLKLRQATTDWFSRWFYSRPAPAVEPEFKAEPPASLTCTSNGSLRYSRQGDTIFDRIRRKESTLPVRKSVPGQFESARVEIIEQIKRLTRYRPNTDPLSPRRLVTTVRKGYRIEKVEFLSEPGIYIPTWVFLPEKQNTDARAILYVNDTGIAEEGSDGMEFGVLERLARRGNVVVSIEVRGIGLTAPEHQQEVSAADTFSQLFSVETAAAYMAWFVNESLFGMRILDVIRGVDYALGRPDGHSGGLRAIGSGRGALWLLYAAALDPRIHSLVCHSGLLSYKALASSDRYLYAADVFIPDVLLSFDLPDVAATLAGRPLTLISPLDAMKQPVDITAARKAYERTFRAYADSQATARFRILETNRQTDLSDQYLEALES